MKPILRCAIYTRKSSEEGLEQDFNSLQAQREACAAYIASQKHEGWQVIKTHYDDGGFSGGTMERPALKQLLGDIEAGKVNIVIVYKVDRLTRALTDFAKIIERFDHHGVSFVSVTQQFNTTSSMGRLTLNVLLSFAQFEREVTGERIRDKIAASKAKGMWMGGFVPLGYDVKERKLLVNAKDAKTVRQIYRRYLELGCVRLLQQDLDKNGTHSRSGNVMSRGALYSLLSNPIYIGQIRHKGICHPGLHEPIVNQALWRQVQEHMANNRIGTQTRSRKTEACPLANKLFDTSGARLVPVHANKKGRRYRYYISESLKKTVREDAPDGWRLPGQEIERVIAQAALQLLHDEEAMTTTLQASGIVTHRISAAIHAIKTISCSSAETIDRFVQRVVLRQDGISLTLSLASLTKDQPATITHDVPMQMRRRGVEMRLVVGGHGPARVDPILVKTIIRAHQWFSELTTGRVKNMAEIAAREDIDKSYVARVMDLAFLAPDITESILAGRQPAELSVEKLTKHMDLPLDWSEQRQLLRVT